MSKSKAPKRDPLNKEIPTKKPAPDTQIKRQNGLIVTDDRYGRTVTNIKPSPTKKDDDDDDHF